MVDLSRLIPIWEGHLLETPNPCGRVASCVPMCISKDVCRPAGALRCKKLLPGRTCQGGKFDPSQILKLFGICTSWSSPRLPHRVGQRQGCLLPQRWHQSHPWQKIIVNDQKNSTKKSPNLLFHKNLFHLKQERDHRDAKTPWSRIHYLLNKRRKQSQTYGICKL